VSGPFFRSRWVEVPEYVGEAPGSGLPAGFRAAGVAAGIKPSGGLDVGLLVSDAPQTTSAARFTRSGTAAAPVLVTRERARLDALRVVAVNSGNANAATGRPGLDEAARMQGAGAMAGRTSEDKVAVCSTGVIGVQLDGRAVVKGLLDASRELRPEGDGDFQRAIMTTDLFEKRASLDVDLPGGTVRLAAQCKGAGMIQPSYATMLCFVETDAVLGAETADLLLAVDIVRDGEGSRRIGRVVVRGGDGANVERAARAVGNSPLVKTALHGGDPNWGRIAQAVGMALADTAPLPVDIAIEGVQVCVAGMAVEHDEDALRERVSRDEVEYAIGLPGDGHETEVLFSDFGHEYIRINAEYTT
jgi:glutamate N-acetyltransferase / amino-acid N-acetyltransferase